MGEDGSSGGLAQQIVLCECDRDRRLRHKQTTTTKKEKYHLGHRGLAMLRLSGLHHKKKRQQQDKVGNELKVPCSLRNGPMPEQERDARCRAR